MCQEYLFLLKLSFLFSYILYISMLGDYLKDFLVLINQYPLVVETGSSSLSKAITFPSSLYIIGIGQPQYLCLDIPQSLSLETVFILPIFFSFIFFSIIFSCAILGSNYLENLN